MVNSIDRYAPGTLVRLRWTFGVNATTLSRPAARDALTIVPYNVGGYTDGDTLIIGGMTDREERITIAASGVVAATRVVTLSTALAFAHPAGEPVEEAVTPTAVALSLMTPDGAITTKTITDLTPEATGVYYYDAVYSLEGTHRWRVVPTINAVNGQALEGAFEIADSRFV